MDDRGKGADSLKHFMSENSDHKLYDYSSLELADQCLRKYKYKYVDGVADQTGIEAEFSKNLIHPVIGLAYTMSYERFHDMRQNRRFWEPMWAKFQGSGVRAATSRQAVYTLDMAQRLVNAFCTAYPIESEEYSLEGIEQLYWRVLPGLKCAVWVAKPDLMLRRRGDQRQVAAEIKVSSWPFNRSLNIMDRQLLSQAWVSDSAINMKIFLQIVLEREKLINLEAQREVKPTDPEMMAEWLDETQFSVGVLQDAQRSDIWPKRAPRSCMDFNKPCAYIHICPLGSSKRMVMAGFAKREPFDYLWQ